MIEYQTKRWESVREGTELPPLDFGTLTVTTLVMDVAGTRDIGNPLHHDREFAKANNPSRQDIFVNTMWYQGLLGRYATDWGGPESFLRKLRFDMRAMNCPGDTLTVRGKVVRTYEAASQKLVDLEVRIDNQLQPDTVVAAITLELL